MPLEIHLDDVVQLRKPHPCGGTEWQVVRVGADIGIRCLTCGRRVLLPRRELCIRDRHPPSSHAAFFLLPGSLTKPPGLIRVTPSAASWRLPGAPQAPPKYMWRGHPASLFRLDGVRLDSSFSAKQKEEEGPP